MMNIKIVINTLKRCVSGLVEAVRSEPEYRHKRRICLARQVNSAGEYKDWLSAFHSAIMPRVYLEIGVADGATLSLARPHSRVIAIDPSPLIKHGVCAPTRLFKQRSDEFFEINKVIDLVGEKADLVFLDGLHEFRQVYRDIINVARNVTDDAVVLVHDVLPVDEKSAMAERKTRHWPGDVYKAIAFVMSSFPSLKVDFIKAYPTGLAVITGWGKFEVDALESEDLEKNLREFENLTVGDYWSNYISDVGTLDGTTLPIGDAVKKLLAKRLDARSD